MADIYIVRHGQAAAGWNEDLDPPLSELGRNQAASASESLLEIHQQTPLKIISSPIKRAHQTAEIFSSLSQLGIEIETSVAEIPSPIDDIQERMPWLLNIMKDEWPNLSPLLNEWRNSCIEFVSKLEEDTVIFSHYIAINVLIGHCQNNEQVISYHPDNCSIHHFQNNKGLEIISLGQQAETKIN